MNFVLIAGGLVVVYLLLQSQHARITAGITRIPSSTLPAGDLNLNTYGGLLADQVPRVGGPNEAQIAVASLSTGTVAGVGAATSPAGFLGLSGAAAGAAAGGIGAGLAIFAALWGAHEQRAAQARGENEAMNIGVANFDQSIQAINAAYNSGQIDRATAIAALKESLRRYWAGVYPKIQPGRNGCNATPDGRASYPSFPIPATYCSGSIGAACCVGVADLYQSLYGPVGAITLLQSRSSGQSQVLKVYGSKYGGQAREGYTLAWAPPR